MRNRILTGALALALVAALAREAAADVTQSLPARLSFMAVTTLSLEACNRSDDAVTDTINFTYAGDVRTLADQYVKATYACNLAAYRINVYTANRATVDPDNANWGALVGTDTSHRLPLVWKTFANKQSGMPAMSDWSDTSWNWMKDTGDSDYVSSYASEYTRALNKESWMTAPVLSTTEQDTASPFFLYLLAVTGTIAPDEYATAVRFDMLNF